MTRIHRAFLTPSPTDLNVTHPLCGTADTPHQPYRRSVTSKPYRRLVAEHFNDYGIRHNRERFQAVINQSWPPAEVACRLSGHAEIPVTVRIVWARDGETWLDGTAARR